MADPRHRSFFAPETLQVSTMDCGPAALSCMLAGYGIEPGYETLRTLCQTDVDGTSIDSLEAFCVRYGVDVVQHLVPVDGLANILDQRFPLIVVLRLGHLPHFATVWRRVGPYLQLMDPAGGRRWLRADELAEQLLSFPLVLPRETWLEWMTRPNLFREQLERRARSLVPSRADALVAPLVTPDPAYVAALDAALRFVHRTVRAGGRKPASWRETLFDRAFEAAQRGDRDLIPRQLWTVWIDGDFVRTQGGVMLAPLETPAPPSQQPVLAAEETTGADTSSETSADTTGAMNIPRHMEPNTPPPSLWAELGALVQRDGSFLWKAMALSALVLTLASALELVIYRSALDAPRLFTTLHTRGQGLLLVLVPAALVLIVELLSTRAAAHLGRRVELALRMATAYALPRVDDDFIRSRPTTDLASRAHYLASGGQLPVSALGAVRALGDLAITLAAIAWLSLTYLVPALLGGVLLMLSFSIARSRLRELDTRNQIHSSRLLTMFLDVLRGLRPLRLHGYEDAFRIDQRQELLRWRTTGLAFVRVRAILDAASGTISTALLVAVFVLFTRGNGDPRAFILLAFWTFRIPPLLSALRSFSESYPMQRIALTRLLEVTRYARERGCAAHVDTKKGAALELSNVTVSVSGVDILTDLSLAIRPGEHVAVVGRSGSGKSSLVSLLLGILRPADGACMVDGELLDDARLAALRRATAWIDPAVQLWDTSVRKNLDYATDGFPRRPFLEIAEQTQLIDVLNHLDRGLDTPVGPEGAQLSGGEGQRVRVARALLRDGIRLAVLDEAFRGLDHDSRLRLLHHTLELCKDVTLVYVTHDVEHALHFTRVLVMQNGRLVEDGVPSELASTKSAFARLIAAARQARTELWADRAWRRIRVADGAISEGPKRG